MRFKVESLYQRITEIEVEEIDFEKEIVTFEVANGQITIVTTDGKIYTRREEEANPDPRRSYYQVIYTPKPRKKREPERTPDEQIPAPDPENSEDRNRC